MSDEVRRSRERLERMMAKLEGDGPVEKQIILLKLTDLLETAPDFGVKPELSPASPQRQWLARVGALLTRLDSVEKKINFQSSMGMLNRYWEYSIRQIQGQVVDAIEELKLELELDGRSEIGNAYAEGEVYKFFSDLKSIVNGARSRVFLVDPYFDGQSFDTYLSSLQPNLELRVLADKYSKDVGAYVRKHVEEYSSNVLLRRSKALHDRVLFIDDDYAWVMGGSVKDAGKKATYLVPLQPQLAAQKLQIYEAVWDEAKEVDV